jgi:hypothetical protein
MSDFRSRRRQPYITEESYLISSKYREDSIARDLARLARGQASSEVRATRTTDVATNTWENWLLRHTGGEGLEVLAASLSEVVQAFEHGVREERIHEKNPHYPAFIYFDSVDPYADLLCLISSSILLHREDLLPRILGLIEGSTYDGQDAVVEGLLRPYLPDRPTPDDCLYKPYDKLVAVIDADVAGARTKKMEGYVKGWYRSMKGAAMFYGNDTSITRPEDVDDEWSAPAGSTPYTGYWTMEAAAFTYLLDLDDTSYRNEVTYPKDMIDYARAHPRRTVAEAIQAASRAPRTHIPAGEGCPQDGWWFSPAKPGSRRYFKEGEVMPKLETQYGDTFWQWDADQSAPKL